jgi:uncharacterized membrane protein
METSAMLFRPCLGESRRERGQVLVWMIALLPVLVVLLGLVIDGGLLFVQHRRAQWAVDGAAVAAASDIDQAHYQRTGQVAIRAEAEKTARDFAEINYPDLHVPAGGVIIDQENGVVYVQAWFTFRPAFMSMAGVTEVQLPVRARERPAWGAVQERE